MYFVFFELMPILSASQSFHKTTKKDKKVNNKSRNLQERKEEGNEIKTRSYSPFEFINVSYIIPLLPSTSQFSRGDACSNPMKINNNAIMSTPRFENGRLISASKQLNGGKKKECTAKVTRVIILDHMAISPRGFYKLWLIDSLLKYTCLIQHYKKWTKMYIHRYCDRL